MVKNQTLSYIKKHYILYLLLLLPIAYYLIFRYAPMYGIIIAFKNYSITRGIQGSQWVGLEVFRKLLKMPKFWRAVRNTLVLNGLGLVLGFPAPIILALLLNELRNRIFKKVIQTVLYLPHFLSWVIIGGMAIQLFANTTGIVNICLNRLGIPSMPFLSDNFWWIGTYVIVGIWQSAGWGAIIYMSAISGIDQDQYEAARIDGCSQFKMIFYITIPNIIPTILIMLILQLGSMVSIGFEQPLMMSNPMVYDVSDVLSTYVYNVGIQNGKFSLATAIGLFQAVINFGMVLASNKFSNKISDQGIW